MYQTGAVPFDFRATHALSLVPICHIKNLFPRVLHRTGFFSVAEVGSALLGVRNEAYAAANFDSVEIRVFQMGGEMHVQIIFNYRSI